MVTRYRTRGTRLAGCRRRPRVVGLAFLSVLVAWRVLRAIAPRVARFGNHAACHASGVAPQTVGPVLIATRGARNKTRWRPPRFAAQSDSMRGPISNIA